MDNSIKIILIVIVVFMLFGCSCSCKKVENFTAENDRCKNFKNSKTCAEEGCYWDDDDPSKPITCRELKCSDHNIQRYKIYDEYQKPNCPNESACRKKMMNDMKNDCNVNCKWKVQENTNEGICISPKVMRDELGTTDTLDEPIVSGMVGKMDVLGVDPLKEKQRLNDRELAQVIFQGKPEMVKRSEDVDKAGVNKTAKANTFGFIDDFSGRPDPSWIVDRHGSFDKNKEVFNITGSHNSFTTIKRYTNYRSVPSFSSIITVNLLEEFFNVDAFFHWKFSGRDGFLEIVLNYLGEMRIFHGYKDGRSGNIQPNTEIPIANGNDLTLTLDYDATNDDIDVLYSISNKNLRGEDYSLYSGSGINESFGDFITKSVEFKVYFSDTSSHPTVQIKEWSMKAL